MRVFTSPARTSVYSFRMSHRSAWRLDPQRGTEKIVIPQNFTALKLANNRFFPNKLLSLLTHQS